MIEAKAFLYRSLKDLSKYIFQSVIEVNLIRHRWCAFFQVFPNQSHFPEMICQHLTSSSRSPIVLIAPHAKNDR